MVLRKASEKGSAMSEQRPSLILNFLIRALLGLAIIFFINEFLSSKGVDICVGINGISFLTSGVLGIPGVALLYGIMVYQTL